jgi:adenine-specific DNA-methyltransferase
VVDGEQGGISKSVGWNGSGGFRFFKLGAPIFTAEGIIHPDVKFKTLAAHVWFCETGIPFNPKSKSPFLGEYKEIGYYLLFNGILGDKRPEAGNVLTNQILKELPKYKGPKVIYGELSMLGRDKLRQLNITFKQIPYDVRAY